MRTLTLGQAGLRQLHSTKTSAWLAIPIAITCESGRLRGLAGDQHRAEWCSLQEAAGPVPVGISTRLATSQKSRLSNACLKKVQQA